MNKLHLIATAASALVIGAGVGYKIAEKKLTTEFEARLERETNAVRRLYGVVRKDFVDLEEVPEAEPTKEDIESARNALADYRGEPRVPVAYEKIRQTTAAKIVTEEKPVRDNVFKARDERGEIYVISGDEYEENEGDYIQVTLTYYAGDGAVTDVQEEIIEDIENILGAEWVNNFGKQNDDENVVHVRNEILDQDYEVVRHPGTYRQAVLGEEEEPPTLPSGRDRPIRPRDRIASEGG